MRVRVMPSCFLVLLRHNLRIDGVLIQQKEVRIFHRFGDGKVIRSQRTARMPLPSMPSPMVMRASAEEQASRHARLNAALRTTMPPQARMPPHSTMPPQTAMPPQTTMPPKITMPHQITMPTPMALSCIGWACASVRHYVVGSFFPKRCPLLRNPKPH